MFFDNFYGFQRILDVVWLDNFFGNLGFIWYGFEMLVMFGIDFLFFSFWC